MPAHVQKRKDENHLPLDDVLRKQMSCDLRQWMSSRNFMRQQFVGHKMKTRIFGHDSESNQAIWALYSLSLSP